MEKNWVKWYDDGVPAHLDYAHPDIIEVCAIGVPDEKRGQSIKVFVVARAQAKITAEEAINFCRKDLAPFKIPKYVEFLTEIPRTSVGKPDRKALVSMEQAKKSAARR